MTGRVSMRCRCSATWICKQSSTTIFTPVVRRRLVQGVSGAPLRAFWIKDVRTYAWMHVGPVSFTLTVAVSTLPCPGYVFGVWSIFSSFPFIPFWCAVAFSSSSTYTRTHGLGGSVP